MEAPQLNTHLKFNKKFGQLIEIKEGSAKVRLEATEDMAVDEEGLIHGGFTFGAADFCAMATVNEPFVVLVRSQCEFMAPVKVGDIVEFESETILKDKRKHEIKVVGKLNDIKVFEGLFGCVVLDKHVLKK
ncbi:MAG: PaaI family thioesterase [Nautiliaceae bacterium]|jgi:acyl-coenzyme A thioesterase PaaI-like protein